MGWRVPEALTDRDVRGSIFMAFRKHLPRGVLLGSRFPILVHATTPAVMFLPVEAWPPELVRSWKQGGDQRSFEDLRRLPEGLRVVIDPGVVTADLQRAAEYVWRFHTTVEALHAELTIVEFGCLRWIGGKWRAGVDGEIALGSAEFAERYARPGALLALGQLATDSTSEIRKSFSATRAPAVHFIGQDAAGALFRGEAELELRGTLVPLDSVPPKDDKPSGGLAAISRLFGKKQSDELRFDGVYRTKFLPHDEADDSYCYLRLYPDGKALCMVSTDPPSEFARRFDQKNLAIAKGTHSVKGDTIRIEIRASDAALEFTGSIERNRMLLSTRGFNNRPTGQDEFLFMGWRP
ncbi:MAG: hypothetical protein IPO66_16445 [Rhodanobacteraceae bacterium]|nr:hypothetical protein [Rhodanobacteraceae bacterium]